MNGAGGAGGMGLMTAGGFGDGSLGDKCLQISSSMLPYYLAQQWIELGLVSQAESLICTYKVLRLCASTACEFYEKYIDTINAVKNKNLL